MQVHYYAHFERIGAFTAGDVVVPGDILGYVGTTGNARGTPPHLHYGIYTPSDGAMNPWPLLSDDAGVARPAVTPTPGRPAAHLSPA
jgi:murein DD-endopeptidase MepM/ murein hydrolase activator NlpD